MKIIIPIRIDLNKIDDEHVFDGKKGKYLDAVVFYNDEPDKYGQCGMVVQSVSKELRESGVRGNILGNARSLSSCKASKATEPVSAAQAEHNRAKSNAYQPQQEDAEDVPF
jgi:hypothetical protein